MSDWLESTLRVARELSSQADAVVRRMPVAPTDIAVNVHAYAFPAYEAFVRRYYADGRRRVLALSMNPGRNGAVQSGIPFCDAAQARELLPDLDRLVPNRPLRLVSRSPEMSGRKLRAWAEQSWGDVRNLYERLLFLYACPIAVLRGPRHLNVPLPALRGPARRAVDELYEAFAPRLARAARPNGVLLLGDYAAQRWRRTVGAHPDLRRFPAVATHHPAARIPNAKKFRDWSHALAQISASSQRPAAVAGAALSASR